MIAVCVAAATARAWLHRRSENIVQSRLCRKTAAAHGIRFEDITRAAGIHFVHNNGAFGKKWLPETMGPGVAFIDYDNDGWQDILLVNGMDWPGHARKHSTHGAVSQQS